MKKKEILIIFVLAVLVTAMAAIIPAILTGELIVGLPLPFYVRETRMAPCNRYGVCPEVLLSKDR